MAHCCALGCCKTFRKNKDVSFHSLPKDPEISDEWIVNIKRKDLPKNVFICSDHFEEKWFDKSHDMKQRLVGKSSAVKRKLVSGAIPTLFPYHTSKIAKENKELEVCFNNTYFS